MLSEDCWGKLVANQASHRQGNPGSQTGMKSRKFGIFQGMKHSEKLCFGLMDRPQGKVLIAFHQKFQPNIHSCNHSSSISSTISRNPAERHGPSPWLGQNQGRCRSQSSERHSPLHPLPPHASSSDSTLMSSGWPLSNSSRRETLFRDRTVCL